MGNILSHTIHEVGINQCLLRDTESSIAHVGQIIFVRRSDLYVRDRKKAKQSATRKFKQHSACKENSP